MPPSEAPRVRSPHAAALRDATARQHREVEQRLDVRATFASVAAYAEALGHLLGFHRPLQPPLAAAAATLDPPLAPVPRAERLAADLVVLGTDPAPLPDCGALPSLADAPTVVGVLYVIEGSALGGAVLAKLAERRLSLTEATGASFFTGDRGPQTGARWQTVLELVEAQGDAGALPAVIAGASEAFSRLDAWLVEAQAFGGSVRT